MKHIFGIFTIIAFICDISFVFADDVSDILNSIRPSNPNQESQSQGADAISTQIPPVKEINTGLQATSTAKTQLSKEDQHTSLSSLRDGEVIVASYKAHLSAHDHFSSTGSRLSNAAAIIRQDRANFHKFGLRDTQDESDDFFSNATNREAMEQMLSKKNINNSLAKEIINGNPLILVQVIRSSAGSYYIKVCSAD